jgi:tetratricopeptide (TPR) repeat protein
MSTQERLNQAMSLHQQGRLADAEALYRQVLAEGPDYRTRYLLAVLLFQQQRADAAMAAVDLALGLNPGAVEAVMLKGVLLQAAGQGQDALAYFSDVAARQPGQVEAWYNQGVVLAGLGRREEAIAAYDRALALQPSVAIWANRGAVLTELKRYAEALASSDAALALDQTYPTALFNRGVALLELQRFADSVAAFDQLLTKVLDDHHAWNNRGAALQGLGRFEQALESYDRSVALSPDYVPAWKNRGLVLTSLKRFEDAIASFDKTLALLPDQADVWSSRGDVLRHCERFEEAITSYDRALALTPDDAQAWANRAASLQMLRRFDEARASVEKALALAPDHSHGLAVRGSLLCEMGHLSEGLDSYRRRAGLLFGCQTLAAAKGDPEHKQRHDAQQQVYLAARGVSPGRFHIAGGERLDGPAVDPANAQDIATQWASSDPKLVVIDNLLTPEALEGLRHFCWGSTIWQKPYADGYLGAMPDHGFACPLLAQIGEELRAVFPSIFGRHGLGQWWGFTYDSSLGGIRIHADQAAVNVNFWITPDVANTNPDNGGLVVWDRKPPLEWDFARSNGDEKAARDFLAQTGAKPVTVPYRANRAVIFDSDLFHETDRIEFADGYQNRRINITMLYGRRGDTG